MCPKELKARTQTDTCALMFTAALFTIAKRRTQSKRPSMGEWINNRWCISNGILFRCKKEVNSDTSHSTDESWGCYAKWNKPFTKGQMSYDSIHMQSREQWHSCRQEGDEGLLGTGEGGIGSQCFVGTEFLFGMMKNFWKWIVVMVAQPCEYTSVQSLGCVRLFATPTAAHQASLSITNSQSSPKLKSIESVMPFNHLILCCPLLLLPSIFPCIRVFSNEPVLRIRWPKYWSFSFNISPSKEHPGLISFTMDWLDVLAVQGTLKSLLQHHSSKASILQHSAFFMVQLSHPYMTSGKTITLTRRTFVDKVMSLLFNMLSRLVITFLPRSKRLLTSWLQSPSAVILEPPKI